MRFNISSMFTEFEYSGFGMDRCQGGGGDPPSIICSKTAGGKEGGGYFSMSMWFIMNA